MEVHTFRILKEVRDILQKIVPFLLRDPDDPLLAVNLDPKISEDLDIGMIVDVMAQRVRRWSLWRGANKPIRVRTQP